MLSMHGYGLYVWSSYAIVGAGLCIKLITTLRKKAKIHQQLRQWFKESEQ